MKKNLWKATLAVVAIALVGTAVAVAAGKPSHTTKATSVASTPETPLTGDTLTQVEAAALAKVGGGTVDAATTENDGTLAGAAYEAHVTKTDGTHVRVVLDSSYAVLAVETGPPGPRGPHGGCPGNGETPLTGDTKTQAVAAALAKTGGTADFASTETDSTNANATYEVHVTKTDGTHVEVVLDASFNVLSVETRPAGPPPGFPGGPPPGH